MNRPWVGIVLLALTASAQAQLSVGTSASLVAGYVGSTYCFIETGPGNYTCPSQAIRVVATGGTAPYTYTLASGALPPGMVLRNDAGFSGVLGMPPSATGTYSFTVRATDSLGATGTGSFSITVNPAFVGALRTATVGVPFTETSTCGAGATYAASGLPPGLARNATSGILAGTPTTAGTYTATYTCTASSGAMLTVLTPFRVEGTFTASPTSLTLSGTSNGATSRAIVQVGVSTTGRVFTATASTVTGGSWLSVTVSSPAPGTVTATANPAGLAAGRYTGNITVNAPGAAPASLSIPVTYTVAAPAAPRLVATPVSLDFAVVRNSAPVTKTVVLTNAGTGTIGPLTFRVADIGLAPTGIATRLSVTPGNGSIAPGTPLSLTVTLNPILSGSLYFASIVGSTAAGALIEIPVTVQITLPRFSLSQSAVFVGAFGDAEGIVRQPVTKNVYAYTDNPLSIRSEIQLSGIFQGSPWLTVNPRTNPAGPYLPVSPPGATLTLTTNPTGLSVGDHYGVLLVAAPPAANPPSQEVGQVESTTVVFRIIPANSPGGFFPNYDRAIVFTPSERDPIRVPLVTINTAPLPLTLSAEYHEGQEFLSISPIATTTVAGAPAVVTLSLIAGGITAGLPDQPNIVTADLVITPGTLAPVRVPVVFIKRLLNAPATAGRGATANCVPKVLVPVRARPLQNFSAMVGIPTDIDVTVVDDCGSLDSAKSVLATFSNGDPPVELTFIGNGRFTGAWSGRTVSDSVAMTITASSADQTVTGSTEIGGILEANPSQPPAVFNGGILNGASFAIGGPLSPGSFVTLFGEKLSNKTEKAPTVPLPFTLAGSSLFIGGKETPVFFASDGQVNAIVPYGIATNGPVTVIALRDGVFAPPQSIPMVPAAPGIFMYGDRQGIVVGPNAIDLVDSNHPVTGGQTVVVYCTGLGEVSPAVTAGSPTPLTQLSKTVDTVTMTIGGLPARVDFAGLTPGSTGLYQVNAVVPAGLTPGDRVPVVLTEAGQSSAAAFISVR